QFRERVLASNGSKPCVAYIPTKQPLFSCRCWRNSECRQRRCLRYSYCVDFLSIDAKVGAKQEVQNMIHALNHHSHLKVTNFSITRSIQKTKTKLHLISPLNFFIFVLLFLSCDENHHVFQEILQKDS